MSSPASTSARQASCSAADAPAVMTMRPGATCALKRLAYQSLMRSRSAGRPVAAVYWVLPAAIARWAASCTSGGAVKSGSPMFKKIIGASVCATCCASALAALATSMT